MSATSPPLAELPCCVLLNLAIRWNTEAEIHDAAGNADCGTGSDVPYAMAQILREHAREIETLAYIFSSQNPEPIHGEKDA